MSWKVYMLRCGDGSLYTGIAPDADKRLSLHKKGKGAKYTRGRGPLTLVYTEECGDRAAASRREWEIKAMTKVQKEKLINEEKTLRTSLLIHPEELTEKWVRRMADLGVSVLALHPRGGNEADMTLAQLLEQLKQPETRRLLDLARSLGLEIEYEMHAGTWLLPRALFPKQPELFRVGPQGQRTDFRNFCVTNALARRKVNARSRELIPQLYGSSKYYYLWMDDGKDLRCHCPQCISLSPSDQQLLVMNSVIRSLRRVDPEAKLAYLAYYGCMPVPQVVKPEKGIFLEYAPISRDFTKPVEETSDRENLTALLDYFGRKDSKVLEYWYDNSLFSGWKKPEKKFEPNNDLIRRDIAFYESLGFRQIGSFACFLGPEYEALYGEPDLSAFARK